jgi:hypothetical protein
MQCGTAAASSGVALPARRIARRPSWRFNGRASKPGRLCNGLRAGSAIKVAGAMPRNPQNNPPQRRPGTGPGSRPAALLEKFAKQPSPAGRCGTNLFRIKSMSAMGRVSRDRGRTGGAKIRGMTPCSAGGRRFSNRIRRRSENPRNDPMQSPVPFGAGPRDEPNRSRRCERHF